MFFLERKETLQDLALENKNKAMSSLKIEESEETIEEVVQEIPNDITSAIEMDDPWMQRKLEEKEEKENISNSNTIETNDEQSCDP
jgi:hypothetical protein